MVRQAHHERDAKDFAIVLEGRVQPRTQEHPQGTCRAQRRAVGSHLRRIAPRRGVVRPAAGGGTARCPALRSRRPPRHRRPGAARRSRPNRPSPGLNSSRRCSVWASRPAASPRRLAALPVGAASATRWPRASRIDITARSMVVLPVPGPPVRTKTFSDTASWTACLCSPVSSTPIRRLAQSTAAGASNPRRCPGLATRALMESATARSAR